MRNLYLLLLVVFSYTARAQTALLLQPDQVFDGTDMHTGWAVLVVNDRIAAAGPLNQLHPPAGTTTIPLSGKTLLPGLIEGHSHLFLHPYNETSWDDQVLKESRAERTIRAVTHAHNTLMAGFTTVRDLGTEGAGYDDIGLQQSIEKGIIPGPHILAAGPAIVATGSYGPKSDNAALALPKGAEESDGDHLISTVRNQIGHGVNLIKMYTDYRWGQHNTPAPTFTEAEIKTVVEVARSAGRPVVAHSSTAEGMRRAIAGGVETIEHGDAGTPEIFTLMKEKKVALCPTLAAGDAIAQYRGWKKGIDPEPERIVQKRKSFRAALAAGVTICMGGDVGVFAHGDNVREMELMVEYGMPPLDVLRSATSVNAAVFHIADQAGSIKAGMPADLIAVEGNPLNSIQQLRKISLVMKGGIICQRPL